MRSSSIVLAFTTLGTWTVPLAAFVGGLITTVLVYAMARAGGRTEVVTLILTGIAVNAITGAAIGLLTFLADDDAVRAITFWNLGSLAGGVVDGGRAWCCRAPSSAWSSRSRMSGQLDLLALGERSARHLGVDVERLRIVAILIVVRCSPARPSRSSASSCSSVSSCRT